MAYNLGTKRVKSYADRLQRRRGFFWVKIPSTLRVAIGANDRVLKRRWEVYTPVLGWFVFVNPLIVVEVVAREKPKKDASVAGAQRSEEIPEPRELSVNFGISEISTISVSASKPGAMAYSSLAVSSNQVTSPPSMTGGTISGPHATTHTTSGSTTGVATVSATWGDSAASLSALRQVDR